MLLEAGAWTWADGYDAPIQLSRSILFFMLCTVLGDCAGICRSDSFVSIYSVWHTFTQTEKSNNKLILDEPPLPQLNIEIYSRINKHATAREYTDNINAFDEPQSNYFKEGKT